MSISLCPSIPHSFICSPPHHNTPLKKPHEYELVTRFFDDLLLRQVELRDSWAEVGVSLLARHEGPCETDTQVPIDVVVSRDDKEMSLFQACGLEQVVKEPCDKFVLVRLSRVGYIPRCENQVRDAATFAKVLYRLDERAEHDIAVVGVTTSDMKVRNV